MKEKLGRRHRARIMIMVVGDFIRCEKPFDRVATKPIKDDWKKKIKKSIQSEDHDVESRMWLWWLFRVILFLSCCHWCLWTSIECLLLVANQERNKNFQNRLIRPSSFVENQTAKPTTPFLIPPIEERRDWSITSGTMF